MLDMNSYATRISLLLSAYVCFQPSLGLSLSLSHATKNCQFKYQSILLDIHVNIQTIHYTCASLSITLIHICFHIVYINTNQSNRVYQSAPILASFSYIASCFDEVIASQIDRFRNQINFLGDFTYGKTQKFHRKFSM